ncbi:MAG: GAF domain-containing protein, partial [Magnetococcales bacterium]|nr:GAF domain-containing protein [Magnetococcales bacterium]
INGMLNDLSLAQQELRKAHDEMEQRVRHRTQELTTVNRELQQEIGERRRVEATLNRREKLLEAVALTARLFLRTFHWRDRMEAVLASLGRTLAPSRILVYCNQEMFDEQAAPSHADLAFEWRADSVIALMDRPEERDIPLARRGLAPMAKALAGGGVVEGWPEGLDEKGRRFLENQGVVSIFAAPIFSEARWWGVLVLHQCDGARVWSEIEKEGLLAVADVLGAAIERSSVNDKIVASREKLRELSFHVQQAREQEKKRIAGEIHDELGSILTKLKMDLVFLAGHVANQEAVAKRVPMMTSLTERAIRTVRQISTSLRPKVLDQLGLLAAIEWQIEDFTDHSGIPCFLEESSQDIVMDEDRRTALFRICQEALTNVARHSGADHVMIALHLESDEVVMAVTDDGCGVDEKLPTRDGSNGIRWMWERVAQFEGKLEIQSVPGEGMTLTARLPRVGGDRVEIS